MYLLKKHHYLPLLFFLIIVGAIMRFYNLNWGAPFYFHPDERNIASSVTQLQFPTQLNPHFFAYGSLPIYLFYFLGLVSNLLTNCHFVVNNCTVDFPKAILISRIVAACSSLLVIPLLYLTGKKLLNERAGIIAALLATMSVGFIQFAHFGTVEMLLTLYALMLFYLLLTYTKQQTALLAFWASVFVGLSVATKVSSLTLVPLVGLVFCLTPFFRSGRSKKCSLLHAISHVLILVLTTMVLFVITNPYVLLDPTDFQGSMRYESTVGLGSLPVFYTQEFLHTIPVLYQFLHVYPFLLNPLITSLFLPLFGFVWFIAFRRKNAAILILLAIFLDIFFSQALLYVKWTRYMVPTLPFIYLIIAFGWESLKLNKRSKPLYTVLYIVGGSICSLFALSYTVTAFVQPDTRVQAAAYAKLQIPHNAPILSEVYDLGIVPFNDTFNAIELFNLYDIDTDSALYDKLTETLKTKEYIILPSQRLLQVRSRDAADFPKGYQFYHALLNGSLGFHLIYQTPCDIFCKITYFNDPIQSFEQTASVFDRPTLMVFQKHE